MKLVDISYHSSYFDSTAEDYLVKASPNTGYANFLKQHYKIVFVFHSGANTCFKRDGIKYLFRRKTHNNRLILPLFINRRLRKEKPDVVLVHSIMYIHFAVFFKLFIASHAKVFIQNHAEKVPSSRLKRKLIQFLDPYIDGYLFTSKKLAEPWVNEKLFTSMNKVYEVMEGSTDFRSDTLKESRHSLNIPDIKTFIWVGRLDANKDPLCAIKAFHRYADKGNDFRVYMFYHTEELLQHIRNYIKDNKLEGHVFLKGFIPKQELELWYNASDYYISASHSEGSGYALCEAMACNCIPIVTNIPSFRYITAEGSAGFLFDTGNEEQLLTILQATNNLDKEAMIKKVNDTFEDRLSFAAIARRMDRIFTLVK